MRKNIFIYSALFTIALAGCDNGGNDPIIPPAPEVSHEISFSATVSDVSTFSSFQSGDNIAVSAYTSSGSSYKSDVAYTYVEGGFKSVSPIEYADDDQQLSFLAVYPAISGANGDFTFEVNRDQSKIDNFRNSHLLIAQHTSTTQTIPSLDFKKHICSMNMTISGETGGNIVYFAKSQMDCNIANNTFVPSGEITSLTPYNDGSNTYRIMIVPQQIEANQVLAKYTVGTDTYEWRVTTALSLSDDSPLEVDWDVTDGTIKLNGEIVGWSVVQGGSI